MKKFFFLVGCAFVFGCSTGPGSPKIRESEADGQGRIIPGCRNISNDVRVDQYNTKSYLSTWGSAYYEGAQAGFGNATALYPMFEPIKAQAVSLMPPHSTFCRSFQYDYNDVNAAVQVILPKLGIDIVRSDSRFGIYRTEFAYRQHELKNPYFGRPSARWKVRYMITVDKYSPNNTDVRVFRELHISRPEEVIRKPVNKGTVTYNVYGMKIISKGGVRTVIDKVKWSEYIQAYSVGYNEAWFLTQLNDLLHN